MPYYSRRITQLTMHTVCAVRPSVLLRTQKGDRCWELDLLLLQTLNLRHSGMPGGHLGIVGNSASSSSDLECGTLGDTEENCCQCVVIHFFPCPHNVHTPPNEETELSELIKCPALNSNSLRLVAKVHFLRLTETLQERPCPQINIRI